MISRDDLIDKLADELEPTQTPLSCWRRALHWLLITLLCAGIGVSTMGLSPSLNESLTNPMFILETLLVLMTGLFAAIAAFALSIPGGQHHRWWYGLLALPVGIWALQLGGRFLMGAEVLPSRFFWSGASCTAEIIALGLVPGVLLLVMLRQAAPTKLAASGVLVATAAMAIGVFAMQFVCKTTTPWHVFLWHMLPVLLVGGSGVFLGRWLLRW